MRPVPATVEAPSDAETPYGGRTITWTAVAVAWLTLRRSAPRTGEGGERPPERTEAAEASARLHPALVPGVRLQTGDGPPWAVTAVRPDERSPGRLVLLLDRLL